MTAQTVVRAARIYTGSGAVLEPGFVVVDGAVIVAVERSGVEPPVSGPPLTRRRGHCWFLGGEADTVDELREAVADRSERGCDVVKIMATGGHITPGFLPRCMRWSTAHSSTRKVLFLSGTWWAR